MWYLIYRIGRPERRASLAEMLSYVIALGALVFVIKRENGKRKLPRGNVDDRLWARMMSEDQACVVVVLSSVYAIRLLSA